ncbi:radical SAM protein, partial [bacterium]|nr:radical SAM protein [bacterium]
MQPGDFDLKKGVENFLGLKITRNHTFPYFKVHRNKFLRLVLDLTDRCNLRCKMCFFNFPEKKNPIPDMDLNIFKKIADQLFPITSDLTLSCMAEPLLYKRFPDILDEVKNHYFVHSEYVTNGMLLDKIIMEKSIEASIKTVQISFDGAKMETVEKIRKGADYKKIIEKILLFNKIKSAHKVKYPILRFNYVIMNDNINEVVDVV